MHKDKAIRLAESRFWERLTTEQIVTFQLFTERLCVDFPVFHKAVEEFLGHPVFTHEFAFPEILIADYLTKRPRPTREEIVALIPEHLR